MKRLTWQNYDMCQFCGEGACCEHYCDNTFPVCDDKAIYDRLAAYEDTGLEPEEIELLAKQRDLYMDACGELPLKRIRELAQADRDGRCVVLPAKPDQTIYQWRKGDDCPSVSRLDGVQISGDGEITYPIWCGHLTPGDFGKTVFLTREEAALRREQE